MSDHPIYAKASQATTNEVVGTLLVAAQSQGLSLHLDPVFREDDSPAGPEVSEFSVMFGGPRLTNDIIFWRAYLVDRRRSDGDGFVASGPTPLIALRALWAAWNTVRDSMALEMSGGQETASE